ncbi:hypothetical protein Dimus_027461 [Dionaea muscipula]
MDCSSVLRVKTLHISSPILAARSPFFYKVEDIYVISLTSCYVCLPGVCSSHFFVSFFYYDAVVLYETVTAEAGHIWYEYKSWNCGFLQFSCTNEIEAVAVF